MSRRADVLVIGAGMAGASLAAELSSGASVIILEAEDQPGYHSTGRSAAFWSETYGGPFVQPLTTASGPWLQEHGFLGSRGGLHIAQEESRLALDAMECAFGGAVALERLDRDAMAEWIPGLRDQWVEALHEPTCSDIDVAALHGFYLGAAKQAGAQLITRARLLRGARQGGKWFLETDQGVFRADIVVNAAGAWADEVALSCGVTRIGIQPFRRTIAQLRTDPPAAPSLPLVIDAGGCFYFKPEAGGRIWLSPHDETPSLPCDCAPDEYDVALAIDRFEAAVDWRTLRVEHKWAGLRSFAPDRIPVYGFCPSRRDFFWFAGQGGFGIQTAPAAAKLAAAMILGHAPPPEVAAIDPEPYRPGRLID